MNPESWTQLKGSLQFLIESKDMDKEISSIQYNSLNLPTYMKIGKKGSARYLYDSKGNKIEEQRKVANMGILSHQTRYCDNFIFEDGVLKRILVDGGFIYFGENDTTYHYFLKDHLGSNRAVVNQKTGEVAEQYDYYPFGKQHGDYHTGYIHPYRYNGKELDLMHGLNTYDYGARQYDPILARWDRVDPLAEDNTNVSPYMYCAGNPVNLIDPDGRDWYSSLDSIGINNGQTIWQTQIHYTDCTSQEQLANNNINGTYLGETVVSFDGYYDEQLGKDYTLDGPGSKHATATVYGAKGADDITHYTAFTMTSNFDKYGAIQDGVYDGSWRASNGTGVIPKHYMLENGGPINTVDGNRNKNGYSKSQKNGIFIHRTNNSGTANGAVSTGCLLIKAQQMENFEKHVGRNPFKVILRRK